MKTNEITGIIVAFIGFCIIFATASAVEFSQPQLTIGEILALGITGFAIFGCGVSIINW